MSVHQHITTWATRFALFSAIVIAGNMLMPSSAFAAVGDVSSIQLRDADGNGKVDRAYILIDNTGANTWSINGTPTFGASSGGSVAVSSPTFISSTTANPIILSVTLDQADSDVEYDTSSAAMEISYTPAGGGSTCTNCIKSDGVAQLAQIDSGDGGGLAIQESDYAKPVIVAVTPANSAVSVSRTQQIVIDFSEPMEEEFVYGTEFTTSPNPGAWSAEWSLLLTRVTLTHAAFSSRNMSVTINASETNAYGGDTDFLSLLLTGPEDGTWSFKTLAGNRETTTTTTTITEAAATCAITSPLATTIAVQNNPLTITWSATGSQIANVLLQYSGDAGETWTNITSGIENTGSYEWIAFPKPSTQAKIRVVCRSAGSQTVASGTSDTFTITSESASQTSANETTETSSSTSESLAYPAGSLIKSTNTSAVYYLETNGTRRPFPNERIFKTWFENFDNVIELSPEEIAQYRIGRPMLPKPGTLLIKIQSVAKTYWIDPADGKAHWLKNEAVAERIAGENWNTAIEEIDVTLFSSLIFGEEIES